MRILFLIAEPFVQEHTGKRSRVLVTCTVPMFDSVPQGDVAFFLFQMTHVFQSPDHCRFPGKLEENNITYESKQKSEAGGRGQHVRFGWPDDHCYYDVTAKEPGTAQKFRKWRRRLSLKQRFEADFSHHSSFKWYCIWISWSNYHCSFLRGK